MNIFKVVPPFLYLNKTESPTQDNELFGRDQKQRCIVRLKNVSYSYDKKNTILKDINLEVFQGSSIMIVGSSGSGKTTLLKLINGLLKPSIGSIKTLGQEFTNSTKSNHIRKQIGYIPQQLGLVRNRTAHENTMIGALPRINFFNSAIGLFSHQEIEFANQCLSVVGLGRKANVKVYKLSGGERQRVAIARALMQKPQLILADEFISDLDYLRAREIMDIVDGLRKKGITLIIATHDISIAAQYGQTAVVIKNGEIVEQIQANHLTHAFLEERFTDEN